MTQDNLSSVRLANINADPSLDFYISNKALFDDESEPPLPELNSSECIYVNEGGLLNKLFNNKGFLCSSINIQSLNSKFTDLNAFLCRLGQNKTKMGLIALQEVWKIPDVNCLEVEGYKLVVKTRKYSQGGGVGFYLNSSLNFDVLDKLSFFEENVYESLCIKVEIESGKKVLFVSLYRPNSHKSLTPLNQALRFFDILSSHFDELESLNLPIYFLSDSNINLLDLKKDIPKEYFNLLLAHGFMHLITKATRVYNGSKTLIDHIFTNSLSHKLRPFINIDSCSDHFMTVFEISRKEKAQVKNCKEIRAFSEANIDTFQRALLAYSWNDILALENVDLAYDNFFEIFKCFFELCFPLIKVRVNKNIHPKQPFMSHGLLVSRKTKLGLAKVAKFNPSEDNKKKYTSYRNMYNKLIGSAKKLHYEKKLHRVSKDPKKVWETLKEILNLKGSNKSVSKLEVGNKTFVEEVDIANSFNEYFASIGADSVRNIPPSDKSFSDFLPASNTDSMFISPLSSLEVIDILSAFKSKKSCDINGISASLLKRVRYQIATPLAHIINLSFESGIFPKSMKTSKTIPVFKNSDCCPPPSPLLMTNYRPISQVDRFSTVLEKAMSRRLLIFLHNSDFFYDNQFGFLNGRSTAHAIIKTLNFIAENLNNKKLVAGVFLDVSKAFDSINHDILISKLENAGIRGVCLDWFRSFITDRFQKVKIGDSFSEFFALITLGVLQGSILGAILFLVFINDLYRACGPLFLIKYADDTSALAAESSVVELTSTIERGLDKISEWFKANKLALNIDKTKIMTFCAPNMQLPIINILGQQIKRVTKDSTPPYIRMLGFLIDENLNFQEYANKTLIKISKGLFALSRVKNILNEKNLLLLYLSLVHSHLVYSAPVLASLNAAFIKRIFLKQKRALRIVYGGKYNCHTAPIFKKYNILPYPELLKFACLKFVWEFKCNKLPSTFSNAFCDANPAAPNHGYNLRVSNDFFVPICLNKTIERLPLFNYPRSWNQLDDSFKMSNRLDEILNEIKEDLMYKFCSANTCTVVNCFSCNNL